MSISSEKMRERMELLGISPKKSLGQNFLVSDFVVQKILDEVLRLNPLRMIEIGPGLGALTDALQQMNIKFTLLELDRAFSEYWRSQNIELIEGDAMDAPWNTLIEEKTILVSNLPYQISSSIVIDRSIDEKPCHAMVLMFQKEVAQRIAAKEQTEHYGLLTVIAQVFWKTKTVVDAGPRDFFPPPKITSRVLSFERREEIIQNKKKFLNFAKCAFHQRRKLLITNLGSFTNPILDSNRVREIMTEMKISEKARAEELSPIQFIELFQKLGLNS